MGSGVSRKYSCFRASSALIRLAGQYVRNLFKRDVLNNFKRKEQDDPQT